MSNSLDKSNDASPLRCRDKVVKGSFIRCGRYVNLAKWSDVV